MQAVRTRDIIDLFSYGDGGQEKVDGDRSKVVAAGRKVRPERRPVYISLTPYRPNRPTHGCRQPLQPLIARTTNHKIGDRIGQRLARRRERSIAARQHRRRQHVLWRGEWVGNPRKCFGFLRRFARRETQEKYVIPSESVMQPE